jgi:hypothetical protein
VAALDELEGELENEEGDMEGNDSWEYDIRTEMLEEEVEKLEKSVKPVRNVLTKASQLFTAHVIR